MTGKSGMRPAGNARVQRLLMRLPWRRRGRAVWKPSGPRFPRSRSPAPPETETRPRCPRRQQVTEPGSRKLLTAMNRPDPLGQACGLADLLRVHEAHSGLMAAPGETGLSAGCVEQTGAIGQRHHATPLRASQPKGRVGAESCRNTAIPTSQEIGFPFPGFRPPRTSGYGNALPAAECHL